MNKLITLKWLQIYTNMKEKYCTLLQEQKFYSKLNLFPEIFIGNNKLKSEKHCHAWELKAHYSS